MIPNFEHIPDYLKHRKQWLLWRYENRNGSKTTKVPYQPNGDYARTNDPNTWATFEEIVAAYQAGGFDGIGYAFADDFVGIDLDSCMRDGNLELWAKNILEQFNTTYAEVSPSGTGIHIICKGTPLATGEKKWKDPNYEKMRGLKHITREDIFALLATPLVPMK